MFGDSEGPTAEYNHTGHGRGQAASTHSKGIVPAADHSLGQRVLDKGVQVVRQIEGERG